MILLGLAAWAFAAGPLHAASQRLQVDRTASRVEFAARATMHTVEGRMEAWELDLQVPEGSDLPDVAVFTGNGASMTTVHAKRDAEMHHWMEHERLPEVVFRLTRFTGSPEKRVAEGELTLHGVTLPIAVPVTLKRDGATLSIDGETTLDTTRFGLPQFRKFGMLTVAPEVKVVFHVSGKLE